MEYKNIISVIIVLSIFILIINISTNPSEKVFTGRATTNIENCKETDSGIDAEIGGNVIGSFNPTEPLKDFCVNKTTVGEYYCDKKKSDGMLKQIFCENGCLTENQLGYCKSSRSICPNTCSYNNKCLPIGTRISQKYCNTDLVFDDQKEGSCNNHYECKSNLCISSECLTEQGGKNFLRDSETTYFWE